MPRTAKQRRGEIIYALRGKKIVTPEDMKEAMAAADVESDAGRKKYLEALEDLQYIRRIPGGWALTEASKRDALITIRVTPSQNQGDVIKGLSAALQQFKPLTTMELEE